MNPERVKSRSYKTSITPVHKLLEFLGVNRYAYSAAETIKLHVPLTDRRRFMRQESPAETSKVLANFTFTHLLDSDVARNLAFTLGPVDGRGIRIPVSYPGMQEGKGPVVVAGDHADELYKSIGAVVSAATGDLVSYGILADESQVVLDNSNSRAMRDFVEVTLANVAPKIKI